MVRVLMTCLPYYSHWTPVAPVATALQRAGHTVAVATAPGMAEAVTRHGVEHLPLPNVLTLEQLLADPEFAASPGLPGGESDDPARDRAQPGRLTKARAGVLAGTFARDVLAAAATWRPDLMVRECHEFGGYLAAERLGLPRAVLDIAPFAALNLPFVHDSLSEQRTELGLDPVADPWHPLRGFLAGFIPPPWYPADTAVAPDRTYRLRPEPGRLAPEFAELPDDRPLVLAGLGTVAATVVPELDRMVDTLVTALGELDCTALIAGAAEPPGPCPPNVRRVPWLPLDALLGTAGLFVSHGGFGSVHLALAAGTPTVNLPMFGDQPPTADRIAELGLGLRLDPAADPATVASACARVLAEPSFRHRAAGMARRILADPGYDTLADDLAALA